MRYTHLLDQAAAREELVEAISQNVPFLTAEFEHGEIVEAFIPKAHTLTFLRDVRRKAPESWGLDLEGDDRAFLDVSAALICIWRTDDLTITGWQWPFAPLEFLSRFSSEVFSELHTELTRGAGGHSRLFAELDRLAAIVESVSDAA